MTDSPGVTALLRSMIADDPGRPRLTWYGGGGERIELSAKVLDNWVAKTANLLVDELDAGPGTRVGLRLPGHWRTAVWLLGTWSVGACAVPLPLSTEGGADGGAAGPEVDVLVTTPDAAGAGSGEALVVAVPLPALATSAGPLPPGVLDGASAVRGQPDSFVPLTPAAATDPALSADPGLAAAADELSHGGLFPVARDAAHRLGWPAGVRLLVPASAGVARSPDWLLGPLLTGGSVVLVASEPAAGLDLSAVAAQEGVTATYPAS